MRAIEITEGFFSNMGRRVVGSLTNTDMRTQQQINQQAAQAAELLKKQGYGGPAVPATNKRIVVQVMQPDQTVASKYFKTGNVWTNEDGTAVTNPKSKAYLDSLIATHGRTETIPTAEPVGRRVSRKRVNQGQV
jgi:hypothetical protein